MPLILVALTLFAVLLMLAHLRSTVATAVWIGVLGLGLYLLPWNVKIAAPLVAILSLAVGESLAGLRASD
jgi:hypothetical protein